MRARLTLAFALVMAAVLAATGLFISTRLASNLNQALDASLRARAADVAALAQQSDTGLADARGAGPKGQRVELAQLIDPTGRVIDHTPAASTGPLINQAAVAAAQRGASVLRDATVGAGVPVRLLAQPVRAQGETLVVVVGLSLVDRNGALDDLRQQLLLGGPIALLLASIAGYTLIGVALKTLNEMLARVDASVQRERRFVSDASHELRSPLATLRTELELIARERPDGEKLQTAIGSAVDETDRLARIVADLMTLARAEDEQLALRRGDVPAKELLRSAAERSPAGEVRISIRVPDGTVLDIDRDRIALALDNLVTNALRHTRSRVELVAVQRDQAVELHVTDDGPGFPEDFLPRAWDRFARADAGRTEAGSGLGLSIVRTIAELHGGSAHARNLPDRGGADVWMTLPHD